MGKKYLLIPIASAIYNFLQFFYFYFTIYSHHYPKEQLLIVLLLIAHTYSFGQYWRYDIDSATLLNSHQTLFLVRGWGRGMRLGGGGLGRHIPATIPSF